MPVLQVSDVRRSEAYYVEKLGFFSHGIWGETADFCIVQLGEMSLALDRSERDGPLPLNQYWAAYIYVDDADALSTEYRAAGVEIVREPEDAPYGLRDFDIKDPDGHVLAFGHDLGAPTTRPGLMDGPAG
eukprot:s1_g677.t1